MSYSGNSLDEFLKLVMSFYQETDESLRSEIHSALISFQENFPISTLQYCAQILTSYEETASNIIGYAAIYIKNFFTITVSRNEDLIQSQWDEQNQDFKEYVRESLISKLSDDDSSLRNTAAAACARICFFDKEFYKSFALQEMDAIEKGESVPVTISALFFFNELFESQFFYNKFDDVPQVIPFCISQIVPCFFPEYDNDIRLLSLQISIMLLQQYPDTMKDPALLKQILAGSATALSTINPYEQPQLHNYLYSYLALITITYHNNYIGFWSSMKPLVIDTLLCDEPDNIGNHRVKELHQKYEPVLRYWQDIAEYEISINNKEIIQASIDELLPPLVHLLEPYNPEDPTIDDPSDPQTSFYASIVFDYLAKIDNEKLFTFFTQISDSLGETLAKQHAYLLIVSSIAKGTRTPQIAEFFDENVIQFLIDFILGDSNNRMKESAIYALYNIMKQHPPLSLEEFGQIIDFIDFIDISPIQIRERTSDLIRAILSQITDPSVIDTCFDRIYEITLRLSGLSVEGASPEDLFYRPFNNISLLISKSPLTDENIEKFMEIIQRETEALRSDTEKDFMISRIIIISAISKKLGERLRDHTKEIVDAILFQMGEHQDVDVWKESFLALLECLETGPLDLSYLDIFKHFIDSSVESQEMILVIGSIRVFGKFISLSFDEQFCDQIGDVLQLFDDLINFAIENPDNTAGLGVALACSEISKPFSLCSPLKYELRESAPTVPPHLVEITLNYAERLMEIPSSNNVDNDLSLKNAIILIFSNIYQGAKGSNFEKIALKSVRHFIRFIGNIVKNYEVIPDNVIQNGCSALVYAGRAFEKKVNAPLNSTRIIKFIKDGIESKDSSVAEFCQKCLKEISDL